MKLSQTLQHEIEVTLEHSGYFDKIGATDSHEQYNTLDLQDDDFSHTQCIHLYNAVTEQRFEYLHLNCIIPFFKRHHPFVFPTPMTPDDTLFCGVETQKKQEKVIKHYFKMCLFPDQAIGFNTIERIKSLRADLHFSILTTFGAHQLMRANPDTLSPNQLQALEDEMTLDQLQAIEQSDEPEQMRMVQLAVLRSKIQNVIDQFYLHYKSSLTEYMGQFHEFARLYRGFVNTKIDRHIGAGLQQLMNDINNPHLNLPTPHRCSRLHRFCFGRGRLHQLNHAVQILQRAHIDTCSLQNKIDLIKALTAQPHKLRRMFQQTPRLAQQFLTPSSAPEQAETKNETKQNDSQKTTTAHPSSVNLYL